MNLVALLPNTLVLMSTKAHLAVCFMLFKRLVQSNDWLVQIKHGFRETNYVVDVLARIKANCLKHVVWYLLS